MNGKSLPLHFHLRLDSTDISQPTDADTPMTTSPPSSDPLLSPPASQGHTTTQEMPTVSPTINGANSNGKRPHTALSNGEDRDELESMMANGSGKGAKDFPTRSHAQSGYSWSRTEDEPGYGWLNKKAVDEYNRAADALVHKDQVIKGE